MSQGWWGEGEVKFFIDGDDEFPTIADTGTEDYFGGAWGFDSDPGLARKEQPFSAPYLGLPLVDVKSGHGVRRFSLYRWHILDPIGFKEDMRVTVQALGLSNGVWKPLTDDIASLAVWYQNEPHAPFPELPELQARWGR